MADISKMIIGDVEYNIKDAVAREAIESMSSNIGSKLNLSTPSSDLYNTQFTCVLEGGESIIGTFDGEGKSTIHLKYIGEYTITCVDGASIIVENTSFGAIYNKTITGLPKATIIVTTDEEDFHSQTLTYSGPENGTTTFNIVGQASFVVKTAGTYTLTCGEYTTKLTIDSLTEYVTINKVFNKYIIYGFHVNSNESDPTSSVTYLEGAIGLTPAYMDYSSGTFNYGSWGNAFFMPKPCMLKSDGTVDYYLNENDYTKKENGTASDIANTSYDGNAMMEWGQNGTKIWYKVVPDSGSTKSATIYIASGQEDEDYVAYSFINSKNEYIDHFYTPIYNGSLISNKLRSLSGQSIMNSKTATNELTYAIANNVNGSHCWSMETYVDRFLINMLLVLMGKSLNTQAVFGEGYTTGGNQTSLQSLKTGSMNTKGLFWGSNDGSETTGVKVFGMENWWGTQYRRIAGWINNEGTQYVKLTYGTADGSTGTGYNMTGDGYINTGVTVSSNVSGYITKYRAGNSFGVVPYVGGGSATTYYCDYGYVYTSDIYLAFVGGYCSNGSVCGAFSCNLNGEASDSTWYIGSALSCKPV